MLSACLAASEALLTVCAGKTLLSAAVVCEKPAPTPNKTKKPAKKIYLLIYKLYQIQCPSGRHAVRFLYGVH